MFGIKIPIIGVCIISLCVMLIGLDHLNQDGYGILSLLKQIRATGDLQIFGISVIKDSYDD